MTSTNFYPLMSISHIKKYKLDYSWFVYHLCESKIYIIACDKYILILINLFDTQVTNIYPYTLYKLIWVVDSGKLPAALTLFQSWHEFIYTKIFVSNVMCKSWLNFQMRRSINSALTVMILQDWCVALSVATETKK